MTRKFLVAGVVATAAVTFLATTARAALFLPPVGDIKLKITAGSGVFANQGDGATDSDGDVLISQRPRSPLGGSGQATIGDVDFTAGRITSFNVNGGPDQTVPDPDTLTFVATYLTIKRVESLGLNAFALGLEDDPVRAHETAGTDPLTGLDTIGRFFLYQDDKATTGVFTGGGGGPMDVDFSTASGVAAGDANNVASGFTADLLANFTSGTLLATGSFIPNSALDDDPGPADEIFNILNPTPFPGIAFSGFIVGTNLLIDGGAWFDLGLLDRAGLQADLIGYDGTISDFDQLGSSLKGDRGVFDAGWQISVEDPIQFENPIPEPVTAGLGFLATAALAGYASRRRRVA